MFLSPQQQDKMYVISRLTFMQESLQTLCAGFLDVEVSVLGPADCKRRANINTHDFHARMLWGKHSAGLPFTIRDFTPH